MLLFSQYRIIGHNRLPFFHKIARAYVEFKNASHRCPQPNAFSYLSLIGRGNRLVADHPIRSQHVTYPLNPNLHNARLDFQGLARFQYYGWSATLGSLSSKGADWALSINDQRAPKIRRQFPRVWISQVCTHIRIIRPLRCCRMQVDAVIAFVYQLRHQNVGDTAGQTAIFRSREGPVQVSTIRQIAIVSFETENIDYGGQYQGALQELNFIVEQEVVYDTGTINFVSMNGSRNQYPGARLSRPDHPDGHTSRISRIGLGDFQP